MQYTLVWGLRQTSLPLLQEILDVEQVTEESQGLELNNENVDQVISSLPLRDDPYISETAMH